jgi:hypothetical protein
MDGADLNKKTLKNKKKEKKLFKRGLHNPFLKTPETDCRLTLVKTRVLFDPGDAQNINTWILLAKSPKKARSLQKLKAFKSPKPSLSKQIMNSAYGMPIAVHDSNHASSLHFNNLLQSSPRRRQTPAKPAKPARTTPLTKQEQTIVDIRMFFKNLFSIPPPASPEPDSAEHECRAFWKNLFSKCSRRYAARQAILEHERSEMQHKEKMCVICHEDLAAGQRLAATGCGHVFCAGCINTSLRHSDACPTCRTKEPTVTVLYI